VCQLQDRVHRTLWPALAVRSASAALLLPLLFRLALVTSLFEQVTVDRDNFTNGLLELLAGFILAKKLLACEKHSYAETVARDIFVMPVAGADLFAILNWITAERHSRAVTVALLDLVVGESLLHYLDYLWLREELVCTPGDILF
jgi:hypothetical protein